MYPQWYHGMSVIKWSIVNGMHTRLLVGDDSIPLVIAVVSMVGNIHILWVGGMLCSLLLTRPKIEGVVSLWGVGVTTDFVGMWAALEVGSTRWYWGRDAKWFTGSRKYLPLLSSYTNPGIAEVVTTYRGWGTHLTISTILLCYVIASSPRPLS